MVAAVLQEIGHFSTAHPEYTPLQAHTYRYHLVNFGTMLDPSQVKVTELPWRSSTTMPDS
jgi:hypothetical protein